jgi:hypothetical protein
MSMGKDTGKSARTFSLGSKRCGVGPVLRASGAGGGASSAA